uniref:Uncharacterized protein n=1 Tax=Oryza punctata TaxID=4537 RepID=A0A0E0M363_ORYPU
MHHAQGNVPLPPPPNAGAPPSYHPHAPNPQASYTNYQQGGAPGYQGSNQGYQGPPPPPHSAYQGNNPGYQGGGPGYQGDNPPPYQGGNPGYAPGYHGQGGNPSYQQGGDNYNTGAPAYERDGQGRNYQ